MDYFSPNLLAEIRDKFAFVEDCPFEGKRIFFENAGGALTGFGGTVPSLGFNPRDWNYFRNFIRVAILWTRKFL